MCQKMMRQFDYMKLMDSRENNKIRSYITHIHEHKSRQELCIRQKPVELECLVEAAKLQNTKCSNEIEVIKTSGAGVRQAGRGRKLFHGNCNFMPLKLERIYSN